MQVTLFLFFSYFSTFVSAQNGILASGISPARDSHVGDKAATSDGIYSNSVLNNTNNINDTTHVDLSNKTDNEAVVDIIKSNKGSVKKGSFLKKALVALVLGISLLVSGILIYDNLPRKPAEPELLKERPFTFEDFETVKQTLFDSMIKSNIIHFETLGTEAKLKQELQRKFVQYETSVKEKCDPIINAVDETKSEEERAQLKSKRESYYKKFIVPLIRVTDPGPIEVAKESLKTPLVHYTKTYEIKFEALDFVKGINYRLPLPKEIYVQEFYRELQEMPDYDKAFGVKDFFIVNKKLLLHLVEFHRLVQPKVVELEKAIENLRSDEFILNWGSDTA